MEVTHCGSVTGAASIDVVLGPGFQSSSPSLSLPHAGSNALILASKGVELVAGPLKFKMDVDFC